MKRFFFVFLFLVIGTSCFAQNNSPKAYLTSELYIMLDGNTPNDTQVFEAEINEFNFTSVEQANRFFNFFNDPMVTFVSNIDTQKVIITITPTADKTAWGIQEWAMYFKNKIVTQREQLGFVDFTQR
jgi:hypothetical protein